LRELQCGHVNPCLILIAINIKTNLLTGDDPSQGKRSFMKKELKQKQNIISHLRMSKGEIEGPTRTAGDQGWIEKIKW
jgi:hypothetical protein